MKTTKNEYWYVTEIKYCVICGIEKNVGIEYMINQKFISS